MSAELVDLARRIAAEAHAGQVDKAGRPYIEHVERVAARLDDPLDQAVAWLHDVVEDRPGWGTGRLSARGVGVVDMPTWNGLLGDVERLTHRPHEPRSDYYARVRTSDRAVRVKLADVADNSDPDRLAVLDATTRERLAGKYAEAREALTAVASA